MHCPEVEIRDPSRLGNWFQDALTEVADAVGCARGGREQERLRIIPLRMHGDRCAQIASQVGRQTHIGVRRFGFGFTNAILALLFLLHSLINAQLIRVGFGIWPTGREMRVSELVTGRETDRVSSGGDGTGLYESGAWQTAR